MAEKSVLRCAPFGYVKFSNAPVATGARRAMSAWHGNLGPKLRHDPGKGALRVREVPGWGRLQAGC